MYTRKLLYVTIFIFCIWLALSTRRHANWFHPLIATYGGDVIWAGMFLFLLRILFSKMQLWKLSLLCYGIGVATEFSQLYHAPWIESIRHTHIGGLMLGFGFMWSDLICYAIGIILAFIVISFIERKVSV